MKVHELIHLLSELPNNTTVCLATTKYETAPVCDVREETTRAGSIILISSAAVWRIHQTERC